MTAVVCVQMPQLGLGAKTLESKLPRPIVALSTYCVVKVACGAQHSAAVTTYGDLFTWGRGIEGQLGHASPHLPPELNDAITGVQLRPKPVPAFLATKKRSRPVSGVSCGHNFTVVVSRAGEVWAFGEGAMGQLGVGRVTRVSVPTIVLPACPITDEPFVEVAAGWAHTLARTSKGRVFSWGFNAMGSLGLGDRRARLVPEHLPLHDGHGDDCYERVGGGGDGNEVVSNYKTITSAVKVNACGNCSGALTVGGKLLTWGCDSAGRLGHSGSGLWGRSDRGEHQLRPTPVERLAQAEVTDFALSGGGGVALVPLRVKSVQPMSGPLETGCKLVIGGFAFWDSPDVVVKFTPVAKGHKPVVGRSVVGTHVSCDSEHEDGLEQLTCTAPCFASPADVCVEVREGTSKGDLQHAARQILVMPWFITF